MRKEKGIAARTELRLGAGRGLAAEASLSPAGLWAVAGIVAAALLGSAAVVRAGQSSGTGERPPLL